MACGGISGEKNRLPIGKFTRGGRLQISNLPSELPITSQSLWAGSGKVFFKRQRSSSLVCAFSVLKKVGNPLVNSWQSVRDQSTGRHKEVKFAQNRASPPGHAIVSSRALWKDGITRTHAVVVRSMPESPHSYRFLHPVFPKNIFPSHLIKRSPQS